MRCCFDYTLHCHRVVVLSPLLAGDVQATLVPDESIVELRLLVRYAKLLSRAIIKLAKYAVEVRRDSCDGLEY